MNPTKRFLAAIAIGAILFNLDTGVQGAVPKDASKLTIRRQGNTGKLVVSWNGKGVLKKSTNVDSRFRPVRHGKGEYVFTPEDNVTMFRLEGEGPQDGTNVYSLNVVGYVNVFCPPGLSLIENPLKYQLTNDVIGHLWTVAPDGLQAFKYGADLTYEVSTFDGLANAWSNPEMDISTGIGFYVRNPTSLTITQTFVGEVLQGVLVNPLPAGFSTKGALVPQAGSINTVHLIPGQPGDELSLYFNDGQGGGNYVLSTFSSEEGAWVPDLILNPGQGFWIRKVNPQDWVRVFYVIP